MVHVGAVLHCASGDDWGSRYMYPDSCGPSTKFYTSSTEQKPPEHPHCIHYNKTSREAWLHCVSAPSARLPQEIMGGRGLGATEHTRGRAAVILCNAPLGMSPQYTGNEISYTQKGKFRSWQVKQELEIELWNVTNFYTMAQGSSHVVAYSSKNAWQSSKIIMRLVIM